MKAISQLTAGSVGYLIPNIKSPSDTKIGDTVTEVKNPCTEPLPGFQEIRPMVFSGIYPIDTADYEQLKFSMAKLQLNDAAFVYQPETSAALGFGFRCGFLGLLHMEIIQERLRREYNMDIIATYPSVIYHVYLNNGTMVNVDNPVHLPDPSEINRIEEPLINAKIMAPTTYMGDIMNLIMQKRGICTNTESVDGRHILLTARIPMHEILIDFHDKLKSITRGYGSMDYEPAGYQADKLVKLDMLVNGEPVDAFSTIVHADHAYNRGRMLAEKLAGLCDGGNLSFYDAAAPIVTAESVDMSKAFFASRYDKGGDDYINCPMNKEEYTTFYRELINAESAPLHGFDKAPNVYEGCMPIEVLAKRGEDSIRFGPLKPVGLRDPRTGHRPWAAVQLRRENAAATLFNIVGFQTNLKFSEQKRVFSMIPGLENAEFMRYGVMHRNTFINSPKMLNRNLSLKADKNIFIAGQLSGVEGYMESAASGIIAGINAAAEITGEKPLVLPETTMTGALLSYITNPLTENFQPMGANFGIIPPLEAHIRDKRERYAALAARALGILADNIKTEEM